MPSTAADPRALRRGLTLLALTLVAPGSAQLLAGNRRVGTVALRCFATAAGFVTMLALTAVFWRSELVRLMTNVGFLALLRAGLVVYAVGWAYLIVDAWRIADPLRLRQRQRLALSALNGATCFTVAGALLGASHLVAVQKDFIETVFGGTTVSGAQSGRYNVLLLGGDAGPTRVGIRPDSITVASIDAQTGRAVLFGLPRNLASVPFPVGSVMHREFPNGFSCDGCYLNGVNTWANDHADLFPHDPHPGITATEQAVEQVTGLAINYYVLIDLKGFQDLVDAVGGVTISVGERIPIGGVGGPISGWIDPGRQHLDGFQTLWYARSRATSDDYSRMARQKCVLNAMLQQVNPTTVVTHFGDIAAAGKQIISTSIPSGELATFVTLAAKTRRLPVSTVSFVPPRIDTGHPDYALIRAMVSQALATAEARDAGTESQRPRPRGTGRAGGANHSSDLAGAC